MEQLFYRYNPWWDDKNYDPNLIRREKILVSLKNYIKTKDIIILTGLRRIGKTSVMKLLIQDLIQSGVNPQRIFYISFDDYLLGKETILSVLDEYRKIHKIKFDEKLYCFFDEIAYQKDYEQQLKNIYDNQNVKVFASTSQSSLFRTQKAFITGRTKTFEILPLDFDEYLIFKNTKLSKKDNHLIDKLFEEYLQIGGIPEYVLREDLEYLKELVDDIIMKDIASRYKIRETQVLKDFFLLLMERVGKIFSINKLANVLSISPDTVRRYLEYFSETFLIYLVPRYGKTNERILSAKKIYAADIGIKSLFTGFRDIGSIFENYVYLKIKNRNPSYVYKDEAEIDFLTEDKILIEVKYNSEMNDKQKKLFNSFPAKKRFLIKNYNDLIQLELNKI